MAGGNRSNGRNSGEGVIATDLMTDFDSRSQAEQLPVLLDVANIALKLYDLPSDLTVTLINLSENATYRVAAADGQRWALRIHRDGYHSRVAIASELAWLTDLRSRGVAVTPRPVAGMNREIIQQVSHSQLPRPRHVVLSDWESGREPGIGEDLIDPMQKLGDVTARMHAHSRQWKRPHWFHRHVWDFETSLGEASPRWGHWREGFGVDAVKSRLFGRTVALVGKRLAAYGNRRDRFGLIHCDLRLSNLLIDGSQVKVIDFDDCGFSWFMYDAATPFSFHEHVPQVPELVAAWVDGYRRVAALSREDEAEIPTFIMLRRLLLVAWIGSHRETDLAQSMGFRFTEETAGLCEVFLSKFS